MIRETCSLSPSASGHRAVLHVVRFGKRGAEPTIYIQGGLHADEAPGTLVAYRLIEMLAALPEEAIRGEIVIVPVANPIGLGQRVLGTLIGRFALEDGRNFNRGYPDVSGVVLAALEGQIGADPVANTALLRASLCEALGDELPAQPIASMKHRLLSLAIDADIVLDLHCDTEALPHAYAQPAQLEPLLPLFRLLGLEIILTAEASGDHPFDEAVSVPWERAAEHFGRERFTRGGLAVTVELRGQRDTAPAITERDATAIFGFLAHRGAIAGPVPATPEHQPEIVPLAGCDLIPAPATGALAWWKGIGDAVREGEVIAEIIDATGNARFPVRAATSGILFTRSDQRQVLAGAKLGKIAGRKPLREGQLLGP